MFDRKVELCQNTAPRNSAREKDNTATRVATLFVQVTEHGGRENLHASRIVTAGEIAFTTRFRSDVRPAMFIRHEGRLLRITSVQAEGRRWRTHIICQNTNVNDYRYVEHQD